LASPCHAAPGADTWEAQPTSRSAQQPTVTRRPRLPEHLPVVETVIEPDEVRAAPAEWRRIGEEPKPAGAGCPQGEGAVRRGQSNTPRRFLTLAAFWLRPLYEQIKTTVLGGGYVQMDEPSEARQPA
jgi:hypothetical protein